MNDGVAMTTTPADSKHTENMINRWYRLVEAARRELHSESWKQATAFYRDAYLQAELLLVVSNCKNCAIKCYMRTLIEYGYALRKIGERALLSELVVHGWHALNAQVSESLVIQLLEPLRTLEYASNKECEIFINQLFIEDAVNKQQLH